MPDTFTDITPLEALGAMASATAPTLLDVRLPEDNDGTSVYGALPVSFEDLDAHIAASTFGAIVICHKGLKISAGVTARLLRHGIPARRLSGGHVGWRNAGLPAADTEAPSSIAVPLDADAPETLAAWATLRFVAPRADLLEVPRSDLGGVCARFAADGPAKLPDLPGLPMLETSLATIELALPACPPSALFPSLDLAFHGALRHNSQADAFSSVAQEARP